MHWKKWMNQHQQHKKLHNCYNQVGGEFELVEVTMVQISEDGQGEANSKMIEI